MTPQINTNELVWFDGEEMAPIDFPDVFADLTPHEREELEREISDFQRSELARLDKQRRQAESANWKHQWEQTGGDIADFARDHATTGADMDYIAKQCGFHQTTWNDGRNVTRRAKVAKTKRQDTHKAQQLKDNSALHRTEPVTIPKLCSKCDKINYIEAGRTVCQFCEAKPVIQTPAPVQPTATLETKVRGILEAAHKSGTIGKSKIESLASYYCGELFAQKQDANTVIELLEKSMAAKAARK